MSEQTIRERMSRYEALNGTELHGRVRYLRVDSAEFTDWLNGVATLKAKLEAMERELAYWQKKYGLVEQHSMEHIVWHEGCALCD